MASIKLYTNEKSRALLVEWFLKELDVDYEAIRIDFSKGEHKSPEFLKVNPCGKIPALQDGDLKVWESGACLLYVADKYGKLPTPQERAIAAQWVLFANATLGNAVSIEQNREKQMPGLMDVLEQQLSAHDYLTGNSFTVADAAVGAYLMYIPKFFPDVDLSKWPKVQAYMKRLADRPACKATVAAPPPQAS